MQTYFTVELFDWLNGYDFKITTQGHTTSYDFGLNMDIMVDRANRMLIKTVGGKRTNTKKKKQRI